MLLVRRSLQRCENVRLDRSTPDDMSSMPGKCKRSSSSTRLWKCASMPMDSAERSCEKCNEVDDGKNMSAHDLHAM